MFNFMEIKSENQIVKILQSFSSCLASLRNSESFTKEIAKKFSLKAKFRVVLCNNEIAGFIAFYSNNQVDKITYISMIAVKEKFRNQGIGLLLLKDCEQISKSNTMKKINLEVLLDNIVAIEFYKKNGFVCIEKRKKTLLFSKDI